MKAPRNLAQQDGSAAAGDNRPGKAGPGDVRGLKARPGRVVRVAQEIGHCLSRWAGVPVPLFLVTIALLWGLKLPVSYESPRLLLLLNIPFTFATGILVAYLIGRSFLQSGNAGLLFLGCGVGFWAGATVLAVVLGAIGELDHQIAYHNICIWISGACHFAGVSLSLRRPWRLRDAGLWLACAYMASFCAMGLVAVSVQAGWIPLFFAQGQGGTPLRQVVVGTSVILFGGTAWLLRTASARRSTFIHWYSPALALMGTGLLALLFQSTAGSLLSWTGQAAQVLSGIYMLIAALASARETGAWHLSLEQELKEAREQYGTLFELSPDGVVIHEISGEAGSGRIVQANGAMCRLLGYSAEEFRQRSPLDLVEPGEGPSLGTLRQALLQRGVLRYEKKLLARDGRLIPCELSSQLFERQGVPLVASFVRDMSQRKEAEEKLRESEGKLRTAFAGAAIGFALTTPEGRYVEVNRAYCRLTGYEAQELLGCEFPQLLHPGDVAENMALIREMEENKRDRFVIENRYIRKDGQVVWVRKSVGVMRDKAGLPQWNIALVEDITERKRAEQALRDSEERFRVAQELSPDGFTILSPIRDSGGRVIDFTWVYQNAAAARFTGRSLEAVLGKRLLELFPGHRGTAFLEAYQDVAETGKRRVFEAYYGGETFTPAWFRVAVVRVGNDIAILAQDITRQREFQAELQRVVEERTGKLRELVGELEHFSYTITHDMRAPLRGMQGFAELMAETCDNCERQDPRTFLRRIKTSGQRMDALITDALQYTKAVRQELPLAPVDVAALLRGMLDSYPEFQPERAQIQIEGELPLVMGNEAGLTQVLSNLLGNAVKFVKPGQRPEVRVWAERRRVTLNTGESRGRVRLWVEDKGIGIGEAMKPKVFDMFSRGQRNYEGTGIGLALVRKVTERMGGKVGVESEEDQGSRFWIELGLGERPMGAADWTGLDAARCPTRPDGPG